MGKTIIIGGQKFDYDRGSKEGVFTAFRVINDTSFAIEFEIYLFLPDPKNPGMQKVSYIHKIKRVGSPEVVDNRDVEHLEAESLIQTVAKQLVGDVETSSS